MYVIKRLTGEVFTGYKAAPGLPVSYANPVFKKSKPGAPVAAYVYASKDEAASEVASINARDKRFCAPAWIGEV